MSGLSMNSSDFWAEKKPKIKDIKTTIYADVESNKTYQRRIAWKEQGFCSYSTLAKHLGISTQTIVNMASAYGWQALREEYWRLRSHEHDKHLNQKQIEMEQKHYGINDAKSKFLQALLNDSFKQYRNGELDLDEVIKIFRQLSDLAKDERVNVHLPNSYQDIKQEVNTNLELDLINLIDEDRVHNTFEKEGK